MAKMTGVLFYSALTLCLYLPQIVISNIVKTTGGVDCVFPYIYREQKYYACITAGHDRPWCSLTPSYDRDHRWSNCISEDIATTGGTAEGEKCNFPFKFLGGDRYECTMDYHDQLWCGTTRDYDANKKWGNCGATAMKTIEGNSYGAPCCFPFMYQGVEFEGCTQFDSRFLKAWCGTTPDFDKDEQWGYCVVKTFGGNADGANCVFPYLFNGKEYGRCQVSPELGRFQSWCSTTYNYNVDGKWGYCIMKSTLKCEASGSVTVLPGLSTTLPPNVSTTVPTTRVQTPCVYSAKFENTNARGGVPSPGAATVQECMRQCDAAADCVALDFDMNDNARSRCWHHFDDDNLKPENVNPANNIDHYRKDKLSCPGQATVNCEFEERPNTNSFGASGQSGVTSPDQCKTRCLQDQSCVAYEWETNPNPNDGFQCFIHNNRQTVDDNLFTSPGKTTTQFIKKC